MPEKQSWYQVFRGRKSLPCPPPGRQSWGCGLRPGLQRGLWERRVQAGGELWFLVHRLVPFSALVCPCPTPNSCGPGPRVSDLFCPPSCLSQIGFPPSGALSQFGQRWKHHFLPLLPPHKTALACRFYEVTPCSQPDPPHAGAWAREGGDCVQPGVSRALPGHSGVPGRLPPARPKA